jgi:hypothetical protein
MLHIFGGTVVLSAADSNRSIAGGNRSSTKNPFPTNAPPNTDFSGGIYFFLPVWYNDCRLLYFDRSGGLWNIEI